MIYSDSVEAESPRQFGALEALLADDQHRDLHQLLARAGLVRDGGDYRFADLTLKYPVMQFAPYAVPADCLGQVSAAHLAFILHGFLCDRHLDGQVALSREDVRLVESIKKIGIEQVWSASLALQRNEPLGVRRGEGQHFDSPQKRINDLLAEYRNAQVVTYLAGTSGGLTARRELEVASGRAGYGYIAVLFLSERMGLPPETRRTMKNAFDTLVTGLQWADDLVDWREDLKTGDENLLLVSLKEVGLDPYSHPANDLREVNVGHALMDNGIIRRAVERAHSWLQMARMRQESLSCLELLRQIDSVHARVDNAAEAVGRDIRRIVGVAVAIR